MKSKGLKIWWFVGVMLSALLFLLPNSIKPSFAAVRETDVVESQYLLSATEEGNEIYKSDRVAGQTTGYGNFVVGTKDVTITSNSNAGFALAGWQITYSEQFIEQETGEVNKVVYVDSKNLVDGKKTYPLQTKDGTDIELSFDYSDKDGDGYFEAGALKVSYVFESLQIEPVFTFVYYNIEVNEIESLGAIRNHTPISLGENETLYIPNGQVGESTHFTNTYLRKSDNLFYVGEVYLETIDGASVYYTTHNQAKEGGKQEKVNLDQGVFREGDTVDLSVDVDNASDVYNSVNIDLTSVKVVGDKTIELALNSDANGFTNQKDEFLRTEQADINFVIVPATEHINHVKLSYHNLYVANFDIYVDDVSANEQESADILKIVNVVNEISKISDGKYFVKDYNDNSTNAFRVSSSSKVVKIVDGVSYDYYNFYQLDSERYQQKSYYDINQNFTVKLEYKSVGYNVEFVFAVLNNGTITTLPGTYNLENNFSLQRGEASKTVVKTDASNNIGYEFYGFSFSRLSCEKNSSIEAQIDSVKPENLTIFMVYTPINYKVKLTNLQKLSLINNGTSVLPTQSISAVRYRGSDLVRDLTALDRIDSEGIVNLEFTLNIFDSLDLTITPNEGYLIHINVGGREYLISDISVSISKEFLTSVDGDEIVFEIEELYDSHTLTYHIDPTLDSNTGANVIMADLSVDMDATVASYAVVNKTEDETGVSITISNLRLYDNVTLIAKGKTNTVGDNTYPYAFIRFTENGITSLRNSYNSVDDTYSYVETVRNYTKNSQGTLQKQILVVFGMQNSRLYVSVADGMQNAYDATNVELSKGGLPIDANADGSYSVETGEIQVSLTGEVAFGYNFVGYTYVVGSSSRPPVDETNFNFTLNVNGSNIQYLILNFELVPFRMEVVQHNAGVEGEKVTFGDLNYLAITVDDLNLNFKMPEGYYVSRARFAGSDADYEAMAQDNLYSSSTYNYNFSRDEFSNIPNSGPISDEEGDYYLITLNVYYQIHTYTVKVKFGLTNPKNNVYDNLVSYPNMQLIFKQQDSSLSFEADKLYDSEENSITFSGITYGADFYIALTTQLQEGFSAIVGWADMQGQSLGQDPQKLTVLRIVRDQEYQYLLDYQAFEINLVYNSNQGTPRVFVNETESKIIQAFDKLTINTNAVKTNGFKFTNLYYFAPEYVEYIYDESSWAEGYMDLYLSVGSTYVLNNSEVYDNANKYYVRNDKRVDFTDSDTFVCDSFSANKFSYEFDGLKRVVNFYLEYDYIKVTIVNNSNAYGDTYTNLTNGGLNILPENYATYEVNRVGSDGAGIPLNEGEQVDFRDSILINVKINKVTIQEEGRDVEYELYKGLYLLNVRVFADYVRVTNLGGGRYSLRINIRDFIENLSDNAVLNINYFFNSQSKSAILTTNINSGEFYRNKAGDTMFNMTSSNDQAFGTNVVNSSGEPSMKKDMQFLGRFIYTYAFNSSLRDYFKITDVKVYDSDGALIDKSQYEKYGVKVTYTYDEEQVESVSIRMVENITVKLQVQPIIRFNGAEVDAQGNYIFRKTFLCNSMGTGLAQTIDFGYYPNAEIVTSQLLYECLITPDGERNVYYTNMAGQRVTPINAERYEFHFVFDGKDDYEWVDEIELTYHIYLEITPRDVSVVYTRPNEQSKIYDGNSYFNADLLNRNIVLSDGSGLNLPYANQVNFVLKPGIQARITFTNRDEEMETALANRSEGDFYNITLSGFELDSNVAFNKNFNLINSTYTIKNIIKIRKKSIDLVGLKVNNKVFDNSDAVTISEDSVITLTNTITGDDVSVDISKLKLKFENKDIGLNKSIIVDSTLALSGEDSSNYTINAYSTKASIYPYSASVDIDGFGTITVYNKRGQTDLSKVDLIPISKELKVEMIEVDSQEYVSIYPQISQLFYSGRVYAFGFNIFFESDGVRSTVDRELYLELPKISRLTSVGALNNLEIQELDYEEGEETILVDLSQFGLEVGSIIMTKQRTLLKLWQIILIVISILILILVIVIVLLYIRKKKLERFARNDTI